MVLDNRQQERLTRLYYSFIDWYGRAYDMAHLMISDEHEDDWVTIVDRQLWGDFSDRFMFDEYALENPDNFSREDLTEIVSWKDAVYTSFIALEHEDSFVFLLDDDYAFTVVPHSDEIAKSLREQAPVLVQGALVPFEDLITFTSLTFRGLMDGEHPLFEQKIENLKQLDEKGNFLKSAYDLVNSSQRIAADILAMEAEKLAVQQKAFEIANERTDTQHRGALAGLNDHERYQRMAFHETTKRDRKTVSLASALMAQADDYTGPYTIQDVYLSLTTPELVRLAQENDIEVALETSREEISAALARALPLDALSTFKRIIGTRAYGIQTIAEVVAAGGCLEIDIDMLRQRPWLAQAVFPYTIVHYDGSKIMQTMPQEVYEAFRDLNWERFIAREVDIETRIECIRLALEYRGVCYLMDLMDEVEEIEGPALAPGSLELAVRERGRKGTFGYWYLESEGSGYLADPVIAKQCAPDETGNVANSEPLELAEDVLDRVSPRPIDLMIAEGGVLPAVRQDSAYANLVAWLDEHVPNGEDDYEFATTTADLMVLALRYTPAGDLSPIFYDVGLELNPAQVVRMVEFINRLAEIVPSWKFGGWSAEEREV